MEQLEAPIPVAGGEAPGAGPAGLAASQPGILFSIFVAF